MDFLNGFFSGDFVDRFGRGMTVEKMLAMNRDIFEE
jgi:hypothetical protein